MLFNFNAKACVIWYQQSHCTKKKTVKLCKATLLILN